MKSKTGRTMAQIQLTREQRMPSGRPTSAEIETAVTSTARLVIAASHAPMMPIAAIAQNVRIAVALFTICHANRVKKTKSNVCGVSRNPSSTKSSAHLTGTLIAWNTPR